MQSISLLAICLLTVLNYADPLLCAAAHERPGHHKERTRRNPFLLTSPRKRSTPQEMLNMSVQRDAKTGNLAGVRKWIEKTGDLKAYYKGFALLHTAAANGRTGVVAFLLDCGTSVNVPGDRKKTPLHCASAYGRVDIVRLLLDAGADIHALTMDNVSALECAVTYNHLDVVEELCSRADVVALINDSAAARPLRISPLISAITSKHIEVFRTLVRAMHNSGKDFSDLEMNHDYLLVYIISDRPEPSSSNPLTQHEQAALLQLCAAMGANVNMHNGSCSDRTPLHAAVSNKNVPCVRALLRCHADPHAPDGLNNSTPLQSACLYRSLEIVSLFFENPEYLDIEYLKQKSVRKDLLQHAKRNKNKRVYNFLRDELNSLKIKPYKKEL